jgi:hypothetical protein
MTQTNTGVSTVSSTSASPIAVLVGHCGPDSSFLRSAVASSAPGTRIVSAEDQAGLDQILASGPALLLVNRILDYGFATQEGVALIAGYRRQPNVRCLLISNFPEAQAAAGQAGALPGFGKRQIGTPLVRERIQQALASLSAR